MIIDYEQENNFYKYALKHPTLGETGRKYLESRGIKEETIEKWEIGWAPVGVTPPCYKGQVKPFWKKMWGRVTFPVRTQSGKIATISGRLVIQSMKSVKYDMYPFAARKILFGLWQNKDSIREANRAAITEGQMDVITAWQEGFKIATSTFGAHGSLDHLANLSRYAKRIDVLYDADAAGMKGIEGIKKLSTLGDLDVRFKNPFPKGEDLDSWLRKNNVDNLLKMLDRSEFDDLKMRFSRMNKGS